MYCSKQLDIGWQDYKSDNTKFIFEPIFLICRTGHSRIISSRQLVHQSWTTGRHKVSSAFSWATFCACHCDIPSAESACGHFSESDVGLYWFVHTLSLHISELICLSKGCAGYGQKVRKSNMMSQESNLQIQNIPTNQVQPSLYHIQWEDRSYWRKQWVEHTYAVHTPEHHVKSC